METHHIIGDLHLAFMNENHPLVRSEDRSTYFSIDNVIAYHGYCDDFGPMNLASIYQFCSLIERQLKASAGKPIFLVTEPAGCNTTNVVFLLGAYMVLRKNLVPSEVTSRLRFLFPRIMSYRDISPGKQDFHLRVEDCWDALWRAQSLEWINFGLGGFDVDEYIHYDDPRNADLHVIVPDKIIAMKGPISLEDGKKWIDTPMGVRHFSPAHYGEILNDFNVHLVVRLNEPAYSAQEFEAAGITVADIFFEDCTIPPNSAVVKFLLLAENTPGTIAVHCKAGLGRTGTLIALYLMKNFAFTAREAIAWLRIVRPGSVIGRQQQYLVDMEASIARLRTRPPLRCQVTAIDASSPDAVAVRGLDVVRRLVERINDMVDQGERRALLGRQRARRTMSAGDCSLSADSSGGEGHPGKMQRREEGSSGSHETLAAHVWAATQRRGSARCLMVEAQGAIDK